jgi:hypothetical protein
MLKMNYMIIGLMSLDMCFKRWNVVQYVESLNWKININIFKNKKNACNKNKNDHGLTPYGVANFLLSNYTTTYDGGGEKMFKMLCEREAPTHAKYVVFQSPIYMNALLSKHPLYIQSIFFWNIGLHIQNQNWGFSIGEIMNISLLNSHLLSWDGILDKQICKE